MLKKIKIILISMMGLFLLVGNVSPAEEVPTMERFLKELEDLKTEISQAKDLSEKAEEFSLDTFEDTAKFKETVLVKVGLWRTELAEESLAAMEERRLMQEKIANMQADISLAKEIAAGAKMQSEQTERELRELAKKSEEKTDLLMAKIDDLLERVRKLEKGMVKKKEVKLKPSKIGLANFYLVKKEDTLSRIAGDKNVYGDPSKWRRIYEANKSRVENPNLIYPGQRLVIP
ncbi:MAG: LysM peptidoglycan-binding domain-containing protein [Candidatus Aerophobetes bacterium]|nr:LysM peptidoglycan-binding domain-containing protein [Candidatus Aerophobetes bacterium]